LFIGLNAMVKVRKLNIHILGFRSN
jgi:hypothetical protein